MSFLVFELILAAVLIFTTIQGYRRGFVLTLCGFLAVFVAFLGATLLSDALAQPVSQMVRPAIEQNIHSALEDSLSQQGLTLPEGTVSGEMDILGQEFSLDQILGLLGDSALVQHFSDAIHSAVAQGVLAVTSNAVASIAGYIALQMTRSVLFALCFVLVLIAWHFLSRTLNLAFQLPVLSTLNQGAGAAMGLVKGAALLFIACWLLRSLIPQEAVDQGVLLHFFCTTNPFALIAGFF